MRYLRRYNESKDSIESICMKYGITNYTINGDVVDVNGDVNISSEGLTKLPLKFGKVGGYFCCNDNMLTSLSGCLIR